MSEKDKNNGQKISARFARHYLLPFPLKLMTQPHGGHILLPSLKNHWKYINFGFGGGGKNINFM